MKDYYIRFGRKFRIPPTVQIKDEILRFRLAAPATLATQIPSAAKPQAGLS
jgi:hypothetical protein